MLFHCTKCEECQWYFETQRTPFLSIELDENVRLKSTGWFQRNNHQSKENSK